MNDLRAKIDAAHGRLVAALVAKKLLKPERAKSMKAQIKLQINDLRTDKTVPLPETTASEKKRSERNS